MMLPLRTCCRLLLLLALLLMLPATLPEAAAAIRKPAVYLRLPEAARRITKSAAGRLHAVRPRYGDGSPVLAIISSAAATVGLLCAGIVAVGLLSAATVTAAPIVIGLGMGITAIICGALSLHKREGSPGLARYGLIAGIVVVAAAIITAIIVLIVALLFISLW